MTGRHGLVAIVGAGMAGATCARALTEAGVPVRVLDKGRSVGGRLAQRRVDGFTFDHGAQYVTVRDPDLAAAAAAWTAAGGLAPWPGVVGGDGTPALVGVPSMSAPVKLLLGGLAVEPERRVLAARRDAAGWRLRLEAGEEGQFERLVLAVPAPQAAALLADEPAAAVVVEALAEVRIEPCWAAMLGFAAPFREDWTGARVEDEALAWVARNGSKPGRAGGESWTAHARPDWSARHLELPPAEVAERLLAAFARVVGETPRPVHLSAHRWRHALVTRPLGRPCLHDERLGLGLCGDWCLGPRVESAFLSGAALAASMAG